MIDFVEALEGGVEHCGAPAALEGASLGARANWARTRGATSLSAGVPSREGMLTTRALCGRPAEPPCTLNAFANTPSDAVVPATPINPSESRIARTMMSHTMPAITHERYLCRQFSGFGDAHL
jgi:hypothetical protein